MRRGIAALLLMLILATPAAAYDLNKVTDKTPEELAVYMHPETRHLAEDVVRICAENEVSAEFVAAVMRYERRPDLHNWFGWSENGLIHFQTDEDCLQSVIPKIKANYLTEGGMYYNGASVCGVSKYYNNTEVWRQAILAEMEKMV